MAERPQQLRRQVGVAGAVLMGLGSIVGTGVFVSLGLAAELVGSAMLVALAIAAALACFNGLSSAQLAAAHPVSGGTYEYANRTIGPLAGFTAGWMFMTAKSASAATAALGFAGYSLHIAGADPALRVPVALGGTLALTAIVYGGIRRTNLFNAVVVAITLGVLGTFAVVGVPSVAERGLALPSSVPVPGLLEASALLFVAYTGYGRIATLGEEVVEPRRTIPRAIIATLVTVLVLYGSVAVAALGALGADGYAEVTRATAAPLQTAASAMGQPWLAAAVAAGAVTAMLGVLVNLLLGLSRVLLAMARRGDAPAVFATLDASGTTPGPAVLMVGAIVSSLVLLGDVKTTWSFSAFTVLVYYALTNASALRLPPNDRLYPRWISWAGLGGCGFLALWVPPPYWVAGLGLLALGHGLRAILRAAP